MQETSRKIESTLNFLPSRPFVSVRRIQKFYDIFLRSFNNVIEPIMT